MNSDNKYGNPSVLTTNDTSVPPICMANVRSAEDFDVHFITLKIQGVPKKLFV